MIADNDLSGFALFVGQKKQLIRRHFGLWEIVIMCEHDLQFVDTLHTKFLID